MEPVGGTFIVLATFCPVKSKVDHKAPGPNHVEAGFNKALSAPVHWLLVHSYRAILPGAPPPMHWRDAHIWLSPKVWAPQSWTTTGP